MPLLTCRCGIYRRTPTLTSAPTDTTFQLSVNAQGRLTTEEQFADVVVRATPDGQIKEAYSIDLRQHYNKVTGEATGPYGLSPIQLPISPDDSYMLVVGTFTARSRRATADWPAARGTSAR